MAIDCDVVVLGTGLAGAMAARAAAEQGARVWVISKLPHRAPNCTSRAWGGSTWSTEETADELVAQVVQTGGYLSNQRLVEAFASDIPARLADLTSIGAQFDEPMLSAPDMPGVIRWSYRGKDSGLELTNLLEERAQTAGAGFMWGKVATRVLLSDGRVAGLAFFCLKTGELSAFRAPAVVIATGGGACMYPHTDNPPGATGDGIALAYDAGAELVDLECISFVFPEDRMQEALRAREPLPKVGHAHYFLGGVRIDEQGASTLPGLFAAGEATGGLFGAGRLGGSALGDCLVFGHRAGQAAAAHAREAQRTELPEADLAAAREELASLTAGGADPDELAARLREINWRCLGTVKTRAGLQSALAELPGLDEGLARMAAAEPGQLRTAAEVRSMRTVAELAARASLLREETRGCYWHGDFPAPDNTTQLRNIIIRKEEGGPALSEEPPLMTRIKQPGEPRIGAGCFHYLPRG